MIFSYHISRHPVVGPPTDSGTARGIIGAGDIAHAALTAVASMGDIPPGTKIHLEIAQVDGREATPAAAD